MTEEMLKKEFGSKFVYADDPKIQRVIRPEHTCCFTGHRPNKLPQSPHKLGYLAELTAEVTGMIHFKGIDTFITGMASGYDLLAANAVVSDPDFGEGARIICALPYAQQLDDIKLPDERRIYRSLLERAELIVCVSNKQNKNCFRERNQFMVDHSSYLVAYVNEKSGSRSGSMMTCNMAAKAGLTTYRFGESDLK